MLDHNLYMQQLSDLLINCFGNRVLYIGLQGSYLRGEATENSDIDPMVVLDRLSLEDLLKYKQIISNLQHPEKHCGFVCGSKELTQWNPLEICHLLHSTKDIYGKLKPLVPSYTNEDVKNFAKLSVCNLYHEICHRYLHASNDKNISKIVGSYKSVFFILQNVYYLKTNEFARTKKELLALTSGTDHTILSMSVALDDGAAFEFDELFSLLLNWCSDLLARLG